MIRTYSLEEAAQQLCGDSMKDPALWLRRKIRAGVVTGYYKAGHRLRMTEQHIERAITELGGGPAQVAEEPRRLGITAASLRRRRVS